MCANLVCKLLLPKEKNWVACVVYIKHSATREEIGGWQYL